jgi:hypothetical protein
MPTQKACFRASLSRAALPVPARRRPAASTGMRRAHPHAGKPHFATEPVCHPGPFPWVPFPWALQLPPQAPAAQAMATPSRPVAAAAAAAARRRPPVCRLCPHRHVTSAATASSTYPILPAGEQVICLGGVGICDCCWPPLTGRQARSKHHQAGSVLSQCACTRTGHQSRFPCQSDPGRPLMQALPGLRVFRAAIHTITQHSLQSGGTAAYYGVRIRLVGINAAASQINKHTSGANRTFSHCAPCGSGSPLLASLSPSADGWSVVGQPQCPSNPEASETLIVPIKGNDGCTGQEALVTANLTRE